MSSGVSGDWARGSATVGRTAVLDGGAVSKMALKSVRKVAKTGAGMLRVGEKTMPTLRTPILLTCALFTMPIRKAESARTRVQLARGRRWTRTL